MEQTDELLKHGLIAISKSMENGFWLHGHVGAEVLTNTFFLLEFEPGNDLKAAIEERIQRLMESHPQYFDYHLLNVQEKSDIQLIEAELNTCTANLSTSGHGVIFSTLILKAIHKLNGGLPMRVLDGIINLLRNTQSDNPDRYYDHYDYQNTKVDVADIPDFQTPDEAARYTLAHQDYFRSQELDGKFYHFHGNQLHDITHANALVLLNEMGYHQWVKQGLQELRKQIKLGLSAPPNDQQYIARHTFDPLEPSFWLRDVKDEHHFKLAYAVVHLLDRHKDIDQKEAMNRLSGHWELMH